jgi:DNA-binding IclR family transcriptional regulator
MDQTVARTAPLPRSSERETSGSQSVDRALGLLAMVGRHADRGVSLSGIVEDSGLNKPTARRLLLALMRAGLVEQHEESRRYYLGEEAYVLGSLASRRFGLLQLCMDSLIRLSRKTEDTSFLSVRRGDSAICLHREEGTYPVRTHALQAGAEHPLGVGAGSLAILAALPDEEIESILAANEPQLVARYPRFHPAHLRDYVAATREKGFSLNAGLIVPNSWGVGVAIRFPDGRPAGALSIAAIDSRMGPERQAELARHLVQEVGQVEARLVQMFASRSRFPAALREQTPKEQTRRAAR